MKKTFALLIVGLLVCAGIALAETDTQKEVRDAIMKASDYGNENLTSMPDSVSPSVCAFSPGASCCG